MIERLNFYDVYGYLFPGLVLLALLWLPAAFAGITPPFGDAVALGLAIVMGYVCGHLIQLLASRAFSSKIDGRYPSDRFLDDADGTLPGTAKARVRVLVKEQFEIDVATDGGDGGDSLAARREAAFRMCRTAVLYKTTRSYAEQFQAMYVFMRGVFAAAMLGGMFHFGCALGLIAPGWYRSGMIYFALGTTIAVLLPHASMALARIPTRLSRYLARVCDFRTLANATVSFWLIALAFFEVGSLAAVPRIHLSQPMTAPLLITFGTAAFLASHFYSAYQYFAGLFAATVYRDFVTMMAKNAAENPSNTDNPASA